MKDKLYNDFGLLRDMYVLKNMNSPEMARALGCGETTILKYLKLFKIPIRTSGESQKGKPTCRLGMKMSEETKRKIAFCQTGRKASIETKKKMSDAHRGKPNPNAIKAMHMKRTCMKEETKKRFSEERRGPGNPNWRGGVMFKPYCFKFDYEFKESIREKFGRKCFVCGLNENGQRLHVHHVDYAKNSICNGKSWAFVPLCIACHSRTGGMRWYWFNRLIYYWVTNPEINFEVICPSI